MEVITCIDCGKNLQNIASWEPVLVPLHWAVDTGMHAAMCDDCIADVYACEEDKPL